ncbi:MAG: BON domain-containing protein [Ignavibacteriaceae bacterium]
MEKIKYLKMFRLSIPILILGLFISTSNLYAGNNFVMPNNDQLKQEAIDHIGRYYIEQFDVSVNNGVVTVNGQVNSLNDKYRIFDIVSRIPGVKDIKDMIVVNAADVPDQIIKQNTEQTIHDATSIMEPDRIKVSVDNGIIFLNGTVSYYREKQAAKSIATWQKGAEGVVDNLKVLSHKADISDANLQIILNEIIAKEFPLAKNVNISVNSGIASISGEVPRLSDKYSIEEDFYPVLGIKGVIDNLTINPQLYF